MIKIPKEDDQCPTILSNQGAEQTRNDCRSFNRSRAKYLSGEKAITKQDYYSRPTVKRILLKLQHSKCCYCEQRRRRSELAVEHFRPRTAVRQIKGGELIYPGYFWLAYNWNNLYLSCAECNTRFKSSFFPLSNPTSRARSCTDRISAEKVLLVDPGIDDPRKHIRFKNDEIVSLTKKGRTTIEILQLDEENLRSEREKKIGILQILLDIIELSKNHHDETWRKKADDASQTLAKAILPESGFSSMAIDFLTDAGYLLVANAK